MKCPCCDGTGQYETAAPVPLSMMQRRIFEIVRHAKDGIPGPALTNQVYIGVKDGGPLCARQSVYVQLRVLNRKLASVGQRVVHCRSRGYRLERTSAAVAGAA